MNLFTRLHMGTGYCKKNIKRINNVSAGGLERYITANSFTPTINIIKNVAASLNIENIIQKTKINHFIIPIRELSKTAKSRERVTKTGNGNGRVGGLWNGSKTYKEQCEANLSLFYNLMEKISLYNVPYTLLHFDNFMNDPEYLWNNLLWLFDEYDIEHDEFIKQYNIALDPDKIHF